MGVDAELIEQHPHLPHVIAAAEAQQARSQQVHPRPAALLLPALGVGFGEPCRRQLRLEQGANQLVEGFCGAPVLFFRVGGQLQGHHRHRQIHALGQGAGLILDEFSGAALPHQQRLRLEAIGCIANRALHQLGGVTPQVPGLKGGVGHRRALVAPLDHREQQIGVGVALGGVQHVVHPLHRGGDAHGAHVGRAFVGPKGEFHGAQAKVRAPRRRRGRAKSSARSPA